MASVFQKFGGIRPMAAKLGDIPPSTIMSWQNKRKIPSWRHASILAAAAAHGINISVDELTAIQPDDPEAEPASGEAPQAAA